MKIVVPMAGRGSRFASASSDVPKPLVEVAGQPMIRWALESLRGIEATEIIFVVLEEHARRYGLEASASDWTGDRRTYVVTVPEVTQGQLSSVLAARERFEDGEAVLVASCDTYVRSGIGADIAHRSPECRGLISVAEAEGDHWSFAHVDPSGWVDEVAEKRRISSLASTGLYYFSDSTEFLTVADEMIARDERTRGEFYVIPVYQHFIARGWKVGVSLADEVADLGTPEGATTFAAEVASGRVPEFGRA